MNQKKFIPMPGETTKKGLRVTWTEDSVHKGAVMLFKMFKGEDLNKEIQRLSANPLVAKLEVVRYRDASKVDSGLKIFDRQFQGFITGNIVANTCTGWYVRGGLETQCNDREFEQGHLLNTDLKIFSETPQLVGLVRAYQRQRSESVIVYRIFHMHRVDGKLIRNVHGAFVVDSKTMELIARFDRPMLGLGYRKSSKKVMDVVEPFYTDGFILSAETVHEQELKCGTPF